MTRLPKWPFRCPREGWYLKKVEAVFATDLDVPLEDTSPGLPLLIYGLCKQHGRVWLSDMAAYDPEIWLKEEA